MAATLPATQLAVQVREKNADFASVVSLIRDKPVEQPGQGKVLIRVKARPVNPADLFCMMGLYPAFQPSQFPATPGMEGMGEIVALGPGVTGWSVGQRVIPVVWPSFLEGNGLYQQYAAIEANHLVAVPDDITDEQAAVAIINPVTAVGMVDLIGDVPAGEYVTITAATSALGKMLLGIYKEHGVKTIAVVRRRAAFEELKQLGATECVGLDEDITQRINEITGGKGHYAALDCIWGDVAPKLVAATQNFGTVVGYGILDKPVAGINVIDPLFRGVVVRGYWVQNDMVKRTPDGRAKRLGDVFDLFRKGIISTGVTKTLPLEEALEAFKVHQAGGHKILITSA